MPDIKMKVIPKPEDNTRTVFMKSNKLDIEPYIIGQGDCDYLCGNSKCNQVLVEKVNFGQVIGIVFHCPMCGEYNQC